MEALSDAFPSAVNTAADETERRTTPSRHLAATISNDHVRASGVGAGLTAGLRSARPLDKGRAAMPLRAFATRVDEPRPDAGQD